MSLGKRLFIGGEAEAFCMNTSDNPLQEGTSSLVAGYSLDYDASDVTGDYDGTPTDVTFGVDGYINWGAKFNGSSSVIDTTTTTGIKSVSMFVNLETFSQTHALLGHDTDTNYFLYITANNTIRLRAGGYSSTTDFSLSTSLQTNIWHHLVFVESSNTITVYLDGNSVATGSPNGLSGTNQIGGRQAGTDQYTKGIIDQVRFFNKALSSDEVTTLYNESACTHTATTDTVGFPSTASSNLVAYYKLDGSAEDESSNSYDGTPSNVTYRFGRYGTAAVFNGSSSVFDTNVSVPTNWSVSLWLNRTPNGYFGGTTNSQVRSGVYFYANSNGSLQFYNRNSSGGNIDTLTTSTGLVTQGIFHHIAITFDSTSGTGLTTVYVDGTSAGTLDGTPTHSTDFKFGRSGDYATEYLNGKIDQIRIYDKALSSDEVTELYNEKQAYITKDASDPFGDGDEVAFYKFENNANDSTGSNNGTASNVTFTSGSGLFGTYAASFNGSSSYISTGIPIDSYSERSYSFWFQQNSNTGNSRIFGGVDGSATNGGMLRVREDNNDINYYSINNTVYTFSKTLTNDVWTHIALTDDGTTAKLYVNGSEITSPSTASYTTVTNTDLQIGRGMLNTGSIGNYTNGKIDQIRIFDRALDGDEVFKLYAEVIN